MTSHLLQLGKTTDVREGFYWAYTDNGLDMLFNPRSLELFP